MLIYFLQSIDVWSMFFMEIIMRWWIIHKYATPPQEYFSSAYVEIEMVLPYSNFHLLFTSSLKLFKHLKIIKFDDTTSVKLIFYAPSFTRSFEVLWLILRLSTFLFYLFVLIFKKKKNTNTIVINVNKPTPYFIKCLYCNMI